MTQAPGGTVDLQSEADRILEQRARALALPLATDEGLAAGKLEVVRVLLRGVVHAIETRFACEVVPVGHLTQVPGASPLLRGVMNLRGAIVPVFDLAALLGLPGGPAAGARSLAVVLGETAPDLAVQVDDALDVVTLPASALAPAPTGPSSGAETLVLGLAADHTIVLDGAVLLAEPRLSAGSTRRES